MNTDILGGERHRVLQDRSRNGRPLFVTSNPDGIPNFVKLARTRGESGDVLQRRLDRLGRADEVYERLRCHPRFVRGVVRRVELMDGAKVRPPELAHVMNLVPGSDLGRRVARKGPLQAPEAVAIAIRIARALHWAHRRGVLHRDIKPSNVIIARRDGRHRIVIIDLDTAMLEDERFPCVDLVASRGYVAPEVFDRARAGLAPATRETEVYSIAATLFHCLTATNPLDAASPRVRWPELRTARSREIRDLSRALQGAELRWPAELEVPACVRRLVEYGMSPTVDGRPDLPHWTRMANRVFDRLATGSPAPVVGRTRATSAGALARDERQAPRPVGASRERAHDPSEPVAHQALPIPGLARPLARPLTWSRRAGFALRDPGHRCRNAVEACLVGGAVIVVLWIAFLRATRPTPVDVHHAPPDGFAYDVDAP